jgi:hypothetical protein
METEKFSFAIGEAARAFRAAMDRDDWRDVPTASELLDESSAKRKRMVAPASH